MSKKILFIAPYPFDQAPSQRFRFEQYFDFLKEHDLEFEEVPFLDDRGWKSLYQEGSSLRKAGAMLRSFFRRFLLLFKIYRYDYIFIHREASMIGPPVFEWMIAKILRRKFIYDFDDAIWLPNYSESNARFHRLKMYKKVNKIMKWANQITAGNQFLADYARQYNPNVQVIPTTVDTVNVHNIEGNPEQSPIVIGWTGSHTTVNYIESILDVLDKLNDEYDIALYVISNLPADFERSYMKFIKWKKESEIEDLAQFNIGIMPMEDSLWTKGKCGFKGLQYMALSIPAVMSNVGVNSQIIIDGDNGMLCDSNEDWYDKLKLLIKDAALRKQLGKNGRNTVIEKYSVASQREKYLSLFTS